MNVLALAIGGYLGTLTRYTLGQWIHVPPNHFPFVTCCINLIGCFFLGWFFTITLRKWTIHPAIRVGIGTGFTGSFTTFSTFAVETVSLIRNGHAITALVYVLVSILGGLVLSGLGYGIAQKQWNRAVSKP